MLRTNLSGIFASTVLVIVYIFITGFLSVISLGIQSGIILSWHFEVVAYLHPTPPIYQELAFFIIIILTFMPFAYAGILLKPTEKFYLFGLSFCAFMVLIGFVAFCIFETVNLSEIFLSSSTLPPVNFLLLITQQAILNPVTHLLLGVVMLTMVVSFARGRADEAY